MLPPSRQTGSRWPWGGTRAPDVPVPLSLLSQVSPEAHYGVLLYFVFFLCTTVTPAPPIYLAQARNGLLNTGFSK